MKRVHTPPSAERIQTRRMRRGFDDCQEPPGVSVVVGSGVLLGAGVALGVVGAGVGEGVGVGVELGVTDGPAMVGDGVQVGPRGRVAVGVLVSAVEVAVAVGGEAVAVWHALEANTAVGSRLERFHAPRAASYCWEAAHGSAVANSKSP
jgi:hypothetical protein